MTRGVRVVAALVAAGCTRGGNPVAAGGIEFRGPPGSLAPSLALAGDRAVLSWLEPAARGHALRVAVRQDTGWVLVATIVAHDSLLANWADFPSVVPLADGSWLAQWLQETAPATDAYHVRMALSPDAGRSWRAPFAPYRDTSATEHGFVSIVPWGDGAAAVWLDGRATGAGDHGQPGATALRYTTVGAAGTPAPDLEVDGRVCDCCQTDLARTRHGLVAVYRDRSEDEVRDVVTARFVDGGWSAPRRVADDGWRIAGCPVNGPQIAARGDSVVVAWFTAANDAPTVRVAFSGDGGAGFGSPVTVNRGRPVGRVDVVWWGPAALVSWLEESPAGGVILVRSVSPDGTAHPPVVVATTSTSRASGFPRMVAAPDFGLIAWTQPGDSGGVRVTRLGRGG